MSPKEKAKELVEKFWHLDEDCEINDGFEFGRKCALISVSEILKAVEGKYDDYWKDVIVEIKSISA